MSDAQEALPETANAEAQTLRPLNILICVPSGRPWEPGMAWSLARAMVHFATLPYEGQKKIDITVVKGSILPEVRTMLVSRAFQFSATHILWWDTDIKAPEDAIARLVNHNKTIVAANYPTKELESRPTAYRDDEDYIGPVWTKPDSAGLEQVVYCGMGLMLCDVRVFDEIELPYFTFEPAPPDFVKHQGEDAYFCFKVGRAGVEIYIDHDLSKQVAHIGDWEFTNEKSVLSQQTKQELYKALPGGVDRMGKVIETPEATDA